MARPPAWRRYARFFTGDVLQDVDEELGFHLEEKRRDLIASGLTADQADAEARRQFGELAEVRRLCQSHGESRERTIERRHYWIGWGQDLRYAARTLRQAPIVTAIAVLSIAVGVGANTAVFTMLDQVLLRTLPVDQAGRLVQIRTTGYYYGSTNGSGRELSYPLYLDIRDRADLFAGVFGARSQSAPVDDGHGAVMTRLELVTGSYFPTLGIGAVRGRTLGPDDDRVPGAHPVAVISHAYWQRHFGGDPDIVGRRLTIRTTPMTIVGVAEDGYGGLDLTVETPIFVPVAMGAEVTAMNGLDDRSLRWLGVFGRLQPGVSQEQATASLEPLYRSIREQEITEGRFITASPQTRQRYVNENHFSVVPSPGGDTPARGALRRPLWLLMALVGGVLLIACANVASLLLARGAARQRELAVRLSLGATRGRIVRQLLVESMVLAAAGAVGGLALAVAGARFVIAFYSGPESVSLISATPDLRVLAFTGLAAVMTVVLFGVLPSVQSTRPALASTLKDQAGSVLGGAPVRARKLLVVAQVALSLLLLIGAGLFIRSLNTILSVDLGFRVDRLLTFGADPAAAGYDALRARQYAMDLLGKVRSTPGVSAAGFSRVGLFWGGWWGGSVTIEGYQPKPDEEIGSRLNAVSPGYFQALGVPLLMGRDFRESDVSTPAADGEPEPESGGYRAAIVTESFARKYLAGAPLGRHLGLGSDPGTPTPIEIVGVVKDSTYTSPDEERQWQIYFPFLESADSSAAWYYVRTSQDPASLLPAMRRAVQQLDPAVPVLSLRTLETQMNRTLVNRRLVTGLSSVFGVLATLLAMVGLYGVTAYGVTRRTREIGVRMALGAVASRVVWLILREGLLLIAAGVAVALPLAWWLSGYLRSELYEVTPTDPWTVSASVLGLLAVGLLAGLIPALRAARINPLRALRHD